MTARAFLATVGSGSELVRAFGHVALVFGERGTAGRAPPEERDLVAYGYGGYVLPEIQPRFDKFGPERIWDAIGAGALEALGPVVTGNLRVHKVCERFSMFKSHVEPEQRLFFEELLLTPVQLERLYQRVREDFERVEPGEKRSLTYRYDHFRSNCATRVRDEIFAALGQDRMHRALQRPVPESFERIIHESLEEALASSTDGVRLFPRAWETGLSAFLPGVSATARTPADFLTTVGRVLELFGGLAPFETPEGKATLARARQLLEAEIPRGDRTVWDTLFTPKRLRSALLEWTNPETEQSVLAPRD